MPDNLIPPGTTDTDSIHAMKTYKMYASSINDRYIEEIVGLLRKGGVVIYPTDTIYAVGCDALNNRAVEKVCRLKNINPAKQRLSIVCGDISQASEYARIDNEAFRIMKTNLPGPFTFILPASSRLSKAFKGRHEVGIRIPDNEIARHLAEALGNPLLTTSVEWPDADPEEVCQPSAISLHYADTIDAIIDGGEGQSTPSAVVSLLDTSYPEIIREGRKEPAL